MSITGTDRHIIWTGIIVFNALGLFGNLNVIYAHYRLKALRTKYGILLAMLVLAQTICLLYELVGLAYGVSGLAIIRQTCFYIISPYILTYCTQMALMAAISTDLMLSIAAPLRHRSVQAKKYLIFLVIPAFVYGITVLIMGVVYMDDAEIPLCQPPLSLPFTVRRVWYFIGLLFNGVTVISYLVALAILYYKYRKPYFDNSEVERKAMKSLTVIILVFIFSRFLSTFLANFLDIAGYSRDVIDRAQAYMIFPAMTCYSSTFYVCFARSSEYRRIFWSQIVGMFGCCGINLNEERFSVSSSEVHRRRSTSRIQYKRPTIISKVEDPVDSRVIG